MSKRKTKEIIKNMDIIEGNNQNLQWLIVSAFRYSVNRHFTQAMWGIEDVIVNNLHVLDKVFIKQFIDDIYNEKRIEEIERDWKLRNEHDIFNNVKGHIDDTIRTIKDVNDVEVQNLYSKLIEVKELLGKVDQDKIADRRYIYKPMVASTDYLDRLLKILEQEYADRLE